MQKPNKRYIYSDIKITDPKRKIYGKSDYRRKIIERDNGIYTIWEKKMRKSYFLWFCYNTKELKYNLKKYKKIC